MTDIQLLFSPRLAVLQQALAGGNGASLERFWQEIEAVGTPLIEASPNDDSHLLVTFLYHAPLVASSVEVSSHLGGRGHINEPMTRLLQTNLWYKTYLVRPGLRTEYQFSVDGVAHPDQFNARTLTFPPDEDAFFDRVVPESWFEVPPMQTSSWMTARPSDAPDCLATSLLSLAASIGSQMLKKSTNGWPARWLPARACLCIGI